MEFGPKNKFEAGQPISTDEAMNDTPKNAFDTFEQRMQERVADGTYTQEEANKILERAQERRDAVEKRAAEETRNIADMEAYNAWSNMTQEDFDERREAQGLGNEGYESVSIMRSYPRLKGESPADYGKRLHQIKAAERAVETEYLENHPEKTENNAISAYREMVENRVQSGDLKAEEAAAMIERREKQYDEIELKKRAEVENTQTANEFAERQEQEKMDMAERIRNEDPAAIEFLEKHPELKPELVAAVKKLESLEEISKINEEAKRKLDEEVARRNEIFTKSNEILNTMPTANAEARAKLEELNKKAREGENVSNEEFQAALDEIHRTENEMKDAEIAKKNAVNGYDAVEAAIREDARKRTEEIQKRMNTREELINDEREYYNQGVDQENEKYNTAKNANAEARAKLEELNKKAREGENVSNEEFQAALDEIHRTENEMKDAEAKKEAYRQDQKEAADTMDEWVDYKTTGKWEDTESEKEAGESDDGQSSSEDGAAKTNGDNGAGEGVESNEPETETDETAETKADENTETSNNLEADGEKEADDDVEIVMGDDNETLEVESGLETEQQKGLFNKLRNFFGRSERSKQGAKEALGKRGRIAKAILATALAAVLFNSLGGFFSKRLSVNDQIQNQTKIEQAADQSKQSLEDVNKQSLNVDLNDSEKKETLSDLINTKAYGQDIEVNINEGKWSGTSSFFDKSKHGAYDLISPVDKFDDLEKMQNHEKAEAIAEGLSQKIDDPTLMTEIAATMGNLKIGEEGRSIQSLEDWNDILKYAQEDEAFHDDLLKSIKDGEGGWREMMSKYNLNLNHVKKGDVYFSPYAVNMAGEGENPRLMTFGDKEVTADENFDCLDFVDRETGASILDANEIGGYKYNYLKACGIIPENATDAEAQKIMKKYKVLGYSSKCGQLLLEHVNEDSGDEGTGEEGTGEEDTGSEGTGEEGTGSEGTGDEGTGEEGTGVEVGTGTEDEGTGIESTGVEIDTGTEVEGTGIEGTGVESTGDETTGVVPKTQETVASDDWDQQSVTDYDQATRGETVDTAANTGTNINDEVAGSSSNLAQDDFLNGGNQTTGNSVTDATYDGSNTEGWKGNAPSTEQGTQNIQEPATQAEVNAINDSNANPNSAGPNTAPRTDQQNADIFNDILNGN